MSYLDHFDDEDAPDACDSEELDLEAYDDLDERHDDQCEGDGGGMLNCSCGPRQQQRVLAELHALRAATPSSGVTEGKVESGDEIDYDGPCRYCGASESEPCRMNCTGPCCSEASGSPEEMLREIFTAQPAAPADTAKILRALNIEIGALESLVPLISDPDERAALDSTAQRMREVMAGRPSSVPRKETPPDTATVLAGLLRELIELEDSAAGGTTFAGRYADLRRRALEALAAQRKLVERGQGGGEG